MRTKLTSRFGFCNQHHKHQSVSSFTNVEEITIEPIGCIK